MSANKSRKAGQSAYQKPKLRLVPSPVERPAPAPDPELKEVLDDMRRRYRVQRERLNAGNDEPEAA